METLNIRSVVSVVLLILMTGVANAASPSNADFSDAIKNSLNQLEKSPYKTLEVHTVSGSFSGELVSRSKDVIVLKTKTGKFQMKSGKEKILMTSVKVSSIIAVSAYVLDK